MSSFPDDSVQGLSGIPWWESAPKTPLSPGQLIMAFVPLVDGTPMLLHAAGREDPEDHRTARYRIEATDIRTVRPHERLPVAGLPTLPPGEIRAVYQAKKRPCLIVGDGGVPVPKEVRAGMASYQHSSTMTVAPYFGVESGRRAGYPEEFVERVRHAQYPQFMWDSLPIPGAGSKGSILRLDHLQPIGMRMSSFEPLPWRLSVEAFRLVQHWTWWVMTSRIPANSPLNDLVQLLATLS